MFSLTTRADHPDDPYSCSAHPSLPAPTYPDTPLLSHSCSAMYFNLVVTNPSMELLQNVWDDPHVVDALAELRRWKTVGLD